MENSLFRNVYNPDVLSCIANLSNDEVFTPPELANKIIDMLPQELFENPDTTFLDPCCKSGVFLREIAKRLIRGLEHQIPDLEKRIEHIFSKQLFGIAITELTSLLSRRSVYCSKFPNGEFSVYQFPEDKPQGNIIYQRIKHTWNNGKCIYCGASQSEYDRGAELETHAYQFIHNLDVTKLFNMKFDVIIGNPPYQLSDGGQSASATPIYNLFVNQAKKINPRYLIMIIPSRWFAGGRGLESFRNMMLTDGHLELLYDYKRGADCFPGIRNGGGMCYFLWNKNYNSNIVRIANHEEGKNVEWSARPKLEFGLNFFIRDTKVRNIIKRIRSFNEPVMSEKVFTQKPYGLRTNFTDYKKEGTIKLYTKKEKCGYGYVEKEQITKNVQTLSLWKVVTSRSTSVPEEDNGQVLRMSQTFIVEPNAIVTESYVLIDVFKHEETAINCYSYIKTRFFRFLCQPTIVSPDISQRTFELVPIQDFSKSWSDEELYAKYGLTEEEITFIESMIRPMV